MKITYWYIIFMVLVVGFVGFKISSSSSTETSEVVSTEYDTFAQCLTDAGAKFYGAFWCPHCQEQKALFKKSSKLPYIECSTPDGEGQTQICKDNEIKSYPTWIFTDGSILSGSQELSALAEKTNCSLPQ